MIRNHSTPRKAFTLIELLVVITIIVVLLALLVPALDKAIYQAELAVCGARLHAVGVGAQTYAMDHRRWYPRHPAAGDYTTFMIKHLSAWDLRPMLRGYLDLKALVDPLAGDVDLSTSTEPENHQIFAAYVLWFGWSYSGESHGMRRLGDRVTFQGETFNILASDIDMIDAGLSRASHPDHEGVLELIARQDQATVESQDLGLSVGARETSTWWFQANHARGPVDTNYLYGDGGVARFYDVAWNEPERVEQRMIFVPSNPNNADSWGRRGVHIPRH